MNDTTPQTPSIDFKGGNLHLIHINFDNSESSTKGSNRSRDNSKCFDDTIEEQQNIFQKPRKSKIISVKNKENFLNKKNKRTKSISQSSKKNNDYKKKSGKYKIILNLFNEFKASSKIYKEFTQFHFIEKNIKNDLYSSPAELATEIRNIFSKIFATINDSENYDKTLNFCELFEKVYKKYDNKTLTKKCKNLAEIINKLKRELRQNELSRNIQVENKSSSNKTNNYFYSYSSIKNKYNLNNEEKSVKKYKNEIANKIKKLNNEQKRGILGIISNNCIDQKIQNNNVMEINVNKMTFKQLKELDKYLNKCINDNNSNINFSLDKKIELFENEKECDILKNDDLSSCLSDDEVDDE